MNIEKVIQLKGHRGSIYDLGILGNQLISVGGDGWIVSWSLDGKNPDGHLIAQVDAKIFSLCVINKELIIVGDMNGHVFWIDLASNTTLKNMKAHDKGVFDIFQDGAYVYTLGGGGFLCKWSIESMMPVESLRISHQGLRSFKLFKNKQAFIGSSDTNIYLVDLVNMNKLKQISEAHQNSVFCLDIIDNRLISGGRDALLKEWSIDNLAYIRHQEAHWFTINAMTHIAKKDLLVTASRDKSIRLWDSKTMKAISTFGLQDGGHVNSVNAVIYSQAYNLLYSAGDDRSIIVYSIRD